MSGASHASLASAVPRRIVAMAAALLLPWQADAACIPDKFRLAIDIGHYLAAPGATSASGVTEFEYNLALAHDALAGLRRAGFTAAFLIGESGALMPLEQRTRIAQAGRADLFVSLHHDSVQPRYLTEWTVGGHAQHYSDNFHGFSVFVSDRNPYFAESRAFAEGLADALLAQGMTPSLHHAEPIPGENRKLLDARRGLYRFDELAVLRTATMPAALLESAVIVNRAEEQRVRDGDIHARVVIALTRAVTAYCALHPPPG